MIKSHISQVDAVAAVIFSELESEDDGGEDDIEAITLTGVIITDDEGKYSIAAENEYITISTYGHDGELDDDAIKLDSSDYFEVSGVQPGDQIIVKMFTTKSSGEGGFKIGDTTYSLKDGILVSEDGTKASSVDTAVDVAYEIEEAGSIRIERSRAEDRYVSITVIHNKKGDEKSSIVDPEV